MLTLATAESDQKNSAGQTDAAGNRRNVDALLFGVLDFQRTKLGIFFLLVPVQTAPGKANNANDDENNADDSSWFHDADVTKAGGRQSIAE